MRTGKIHYALTIQRYYLRWVFTKEGRITQKPIWNLQCKREGPYAEHINLTGVRVLGQNFWSNVPWGPTRGVHLLGGKTSQPKVTDFDFSPIGLVQMQNVLGFNIAMNEIF